MEGFVAHKLNEFETGKISRRRLIETLTLAATTAYAADSAKAESLRDVALVNHISYTCPDFKKAADWYSMVFNLDQVGTTARDTALPFGKKGDQPYNVTAKDVPLTHLIMRSRDLNAPPAAGGGCWAAPPVSTTPAPIAAVDWSTNRASQCAGTTSCIPPSTGTRGWPTANC